jgi:hypothetical protein
MVVVPIDDAELALVAVNRHLHVFEQRNREDAILAEQLIAFIVEEICSHF